MIVKSIRVRDFLSHGDSTICFEDGALWLISGENGAGKSAFFDAMEYALYGQHRGAREQSTAEPRGPAQNANLLVRNGSEVQRALIDVHFTLEGTEYHLTHTIGRRGSGNQGGRLRRLADGEWQEVNVGGGVQGTWDWLRRRLPSHDLFRSAIYLRQGQTARFLRGTASERIDRFARLIDLSRYTRLSKLARDRADRATRQRQDAEAQRLVLGDTSDSALEAAEAAVITATEQAEGARRAVEAAAAVLSGAGAWVQARTEEMTLAERRARVLQLLADADAIRSADARVNRWDRAVASVERHRAAKARSAGSRAEAQEAREKALAAKAGAVDRASTLESRRAEHQELLQVRVPAARAGEAQAERHQQALTVERAIAGARMIWERASAAEDGLRGADAALKEWQAASVDLDVLADVVAARADVEASTQRVAERRAACDEARAALKAAHAAETGAQQTESAARESLDSLVRRLRELEREQAATEARIGQRVQIGDNVEVCPLCAQTLDEAAHAHLQEIVSADLVRLGEVKAALVSTTDAHREADAGLKAAGRALKAAAKAREVANTACARAEERLTLADEARGQAQNALSVARSVASEKCGASDAHLDSLTEVWLASERERVDTGVRAAEERARQLAAARMETGKRSAALDAHLKQRAPGAEPLGDTEDDAALASREQVAREALKRARAERAQLEVAEHDVQAVILRLSTERAALEAQAEEADKRAGRATEAAIASEHEADTVAEQLGVAWAAVLASSEAFEAERAAVGAVRNLAARAGELSGVEGERTAIDRAAQALAEQIARLVPAHEQPVPEAQSAHTTAQAAERDCNIALGSARDARTRATEARAAYERLSAEIDAHTADERTYRMLADLLKEGGPIQVSLAAQEQRQIVSEVNAVLGRLGDSLRAQLGDPRRKKSDTVMEDFHVVETLDPSGLPRFFEYLSGGEQFRIALALALALHRRVGKQAGTLIVDEGFGALDSRRRHDLAERLTDTTDAILDAGLAESIVICSHSEEVQRQFPNRWHVSKQGDAASVRRADIDAASD
jgi:exonuclease SbcC